jgi:hypothetical protein
MRTRSSRGGVYTAKFGSPSACIPGAAPSGVSGASVRSRLLRSNQKPVLVWRDRARLGFSLRRGLGSRRLLRVKKEQLKCNAYVLSGCA